MSSRDVVVPTVSWAQSASEVWLKLDIQEARRETLKVRVSGGGSELTISAESNIEGQRSSECESSEAKRA